MSETQRFLMISSDSKSLIKFRGDLLKDLKNQGFQVTVLCPKDGYFPTAQKALNKLGILIETVDLQNTSINPLKDLRAFLNLYSRIKIVNPDIVYMYTIKPILYGGLASWMLKVPKRYALFSGLGHVFTENDLKTRLLRMAVSAMLRLILPTFKRVIFQNPDDCKTLVDLGLVKPAQVFLMAGSGVNLHDYSKTPLPEAPIPTFLFIGRLLKTKGILDYLDAIQMLRAQGSTTRFSVLGGGHSNPAALDQGALLKRMVELNVDYLGEQSSALDEIQRHHVIVLPSYREGTPRALLEALAVGRVILTTDVPGCREVVIHGENGLMVPPKDPQALAAQMQYLINNPSLLADMAEKSYQLALDKFDVRKVNADLIAMIQES